MTWPDLYRTQQKLTVKFRYDLINHLHLSPLLPGPILSPTATENKADAITASPVSFSSSAPRFSASNAAISSAFASLYQQFRSSHSPIDSETRELVPLFRLLPYYRNREQRPSKCLSSTFICYAVMWLL